jgi:hypothetical protein
MHKRNETLLALTGTLSLGDFKKFNALHTKRMVRWITWGYFVFIFAVFAVSTASTIENGFDVMLTTMFNLILSSIATILLFLLVKVTLRWKGIREFKSDQLAKSEFTYEFHETGFTQIRGRSTTCVEWSDIHAVRGNKEMFLLYLSKNKAILLPERYFNTNADIETFKDIIYEHMDPKKVHFK